MNCGISASIRGFLRLICKGVQQLWVGLEKVVGWAQNVASALTRFRKAAANLGAGLFLSTILKEVELVETAYHTNLAADATLPMLPPSHDSARSGRPERKADSANGRPPA